MSVWVQLTCDVGDAEGVCTSTSPAAESEQDARKYAELEGWDLRDSARMRCPWHSKKRPLLTLGSR